MPHRYDTDYEIGQDNIRTWGMDIHNPVFLVSAVLVIVFVIGTIMFPEGAKEAFDGSKGWSIDNFDWLFLVAATRHSRMVARIAFAALLLIAGRKLTKNLPQRLRARLG